MHYNSKIYVAGHNGLVGSALVRILKAKGYNNIIFRSRRDLDLLNQHKVAALFKKEEPEFLFLAAGKTGGIYANNTYRADFIYENTVMQSNLIHQAFLHGVKKMLFYACSCIYPKNCPQPMKEEYLLSSSLESTNEPFALSKIVGLKMCDSYNRQYGTDFMTIIPTNLYGPKQRYEMMNSLVVPSLLDKFYRAKMCGDKKVVLWGTGEPSREFLYVDDLAKASVFLMENYGGNLLLNVGMGKDITIAALAEIIKEEVGYDGEITYDATKPDGVAKKLQDVTKINDLGWKHQVEVREGIRNTLEDYICRVDNGEIILNIEKFS